MKNFLYSYKRVIRMVPLTKTILREMIQKIKVRNTTSATHSSRLPKDKSSSLSADCMDFQRKMRDYFRAQSMKGAKCPISLNSLLLSLPIFGMLQIHQGNYNV